MIPKIPILKEFEWFEWFEWFGPSPIEPFNSVENPDLGGPHGHRRAIPRTCGTASQGAIGFPPEQIRAEASLMRMYLAGLDWSYREHTRLEYAMKNACLTALAICSR